MVRSGVGGGCGGGGIGSGYSVVVTTHGRDTARIREFNKQISFHT